MYKIIGADQKEYGPVTAEQLRQWLAEGRVNGQTSIWSEGATEWKPLATFPEFGDLLAPGPAAASPPLAYGAQPGLPEDIFTRDYDLDIGRCVGDAWALLKNNFGTVFGGVAIFMLVQMGMGLLGQIPIVGILVSIGSLIISGPLMGGVYYFLLKNIRQQRAEVGDVFAGFRLAFGQLLLGYIVVAILTGVSMLPGFAIMAVPIFMMVRHHAAELGPILVAVLGFIVLVIPATYLSINWMFSLPLIIDKRMEFWPAMSASWKMVGKRCAAQSMRHSRPGLAHGGKVGGRHRAAPAGSSWICDGRRLVRAARPASLQ
ncbi:MAG: glycerophosphoryl diester phosphodiesterase membrane domain-containing protein [Verrucomicrobia bacterium]|nr:glycerophosphoryl diester phosphodiesterase membrane domain-containing protein [Verrucomicrobiota bacterium]